MEKTKKQGTVTQLVHLSLAEVRKLLKPRDGFLGHAAPLIALYADKEDELRVKGVTAAEMKTALHTFEALAQSEAESVAQTAMLRDPRLLWGAKLYGYMLYIYARTKAAARNDVEMSRAIDAFERFLKPKSRRAPATQVIAPTTTPPQQ